MTTFAEDIEQTAKDEPIVAAVIKATDDYDRIDPHDERFVPQEFTNTVLTWEVARPLLDYEYDDGCHNVHVWTPTRVLFVYEYDGSTWVTSEPRGPEGWAANQS